MPQKTDNPSYTPGPWHWNSYSQIFAMVPDNHPLNDADDDEPGCAFIAHINNKPGTHGDELHHPECRANAWLIMAAPDLYEALGIALAAIEEREIMYGHSHISALAFDMASKALKRARGEDNAW